MFRAIDQCVLVLHALTPDALTLHLPRSFVPNNTFSIFTGDVVESAVWAVDQPCLLYTSDAADEQGMV